jgi:predicted phage terminase large subunit-like protein
VISETEWQGFLAREVATLRADPQARTEVDYLLARRSLYDLALCLAPPEYHFDWHHEVLYRWLNDFAEGRRKRLIVEMPPGHGKSEACSRLLPAYLLGRNPSARIIACSYTADLASEMNRDVQRIMDRPDYQVIFPRVRLGTSNIRALSGRPRRNADIFDVVGGQGFYKCAGIGGGIAGRRFDWGLIDDPVKDREEANSPTIRESLWRWYTGVFYARQWKNAGILLVTTRWHAEDLAGRLQAKAARGEGEPWDVLSFPAIATDDRHPEDPRQPGQALWTWFKPLPELEKIRQLDPRDFAALYQQQPRSEGGTEWPESYFGPQIWFETWPKDLTVKAIGLDPSKGKDAKWGDYSAIVRLGRDTVGTLWCEADLSNKRSPEMIVEDAIEHQLEFQADVFAVETNQFQELLATQIADVSKLRGMMVPVRGYVNTVNKLVRIRRLGPYLAKGNFRFKADSPGTRLLVQQLRDFPLADFNDGPDALELTLRAMIDLWNERVGRQRPTRIRA